MDPSAASLFLVSLALSLSTSGSLFGANLAVGDFDGDGYQDLAVGLPGKTYGPDSTTTWVGAGAVVVLSGSASNQIPSLHLSTADPIPGTASRGPARARRPDLLIFGGESNAMVDADADRES